MELTRRRYLAAVLLGATGVLGGCADDGTVSNPDGNGAPATRTTPGNGTATTAAPGAGRTTTADPGVTVANLGETLVYTDDEVELAVTASQASLRDALVSANSGYLTTTVPRERGETYLVVRIAVENRGETTTETPGEFVVTLDGVQYESTFVTIADQYDPYTQLVPGASTAGWLVVPVEPGDATGRLVVDFAPYVDGGRAEWTFDAGALPRERYDYGDLSVGEAVTFGTETTRYRIGVTDVWEAQSYTYTSGGYSFTREAGAGMKYVFAALRAENVGETTVSLPTTFDASLRTDSGQYGQTVYSGDDGYEGGTVSPGVRREGVVLFEVPEDAADYHVQVDLTLDLTASWGV